MNRSPLGVLGLSLMLLALGFFVGYGFQSRSRAAQMPVPHLTVRATPTPAPIAPQVRGLQASPDGKMVALTGVWQGWSRAGVWIVAPQSGRASVAQSPAGWQDFVTQWRSDGSALLLEREKIPRPVAEASAGLYETRVDKNALKSGELRAITPNLPRGEKTIAGFFAPNGQLILKTRREPKTLFALENETARALDHAHISYGQNRAVKQNGKLVLYVMRDVPSFPNQIALFRVENGRAKQISPSWDDISWSYVAPSGRWLLLARVDDESGDWLWSLYRIEGVKVILIRNATVPADVISVYWSRDEKRVLGAAGRQLWIVDVPSLKTRQLGTRTNWNADDATWLGRQNAVIVAAAGELWRVEVPTGAARRVWRFPAEFWN